jgi:hypothetical protein
VNRSLIFLTGLVKIYQLFDVKVPSPVLRM